MEQSNPWGTASLGLGLGTWVVWFLGMCMGMIIPLLSSLTFPITWLMALAGVILGVIGYRTAMVTDGSGRGASLGGLALNLSWIVLQLVLMAIVFLMVGSLVGIAFLAIIADAMQ
jgi:hypothetical protein